MREFMNSVHHLEQVYPKKDRQTNDERMLSLDGYLWIETRGTVTGDATPPRFTISRVRGIPVR